MYSSILGSSYERVLNRESKAATRQHHLVQFFAQDTEVAPFVTEFAYSGLATGEGVILIATSNHLNEIRETLLALEIDVDWALESGQLVLMDAHETLRQLMNEEQLPDRKKFSSLITPLMQQMSRKHANIRAYGEMVGLLAAEGSFESALALEALWNELSNTHFFSLLCGYSASSISEDFDADVMTSVCSCHTHIISADRLLTGVLSS